RFKEKNEEARVHFIPYLKEGVFVTLCAPVVIKNKKKSETNDIQKRYDNHESSYLYWYNKP
ncbi:hypothetical protein, partial [Methanosarcina mazei]|uniref:hypothetical protein n=1 Tax=Methanosarcina mazei TaxID=2209 RepID=UPI00064EF914